MLWPGAEADLGKVARASGPSRSTSAGSSNGRHVGSKPPSAVPSPAEGRLYPMKVAGLPEYDYPAPWLLPQFPQEQSASKLPETGFPLPYMVGRPFSLEGFYEERQTQSCPVSTISAPPGLEDEVEPEEAAARFMALEVARRREAEASHYFQSASTQWSPPCSQLDGSLGAAFLSETPQFLPPSPCRQLCQLPPYLVTPKQAPVMPLLLDSLLSTQASLHSNQSPYFSAQFNASCGPPPVASPWAAQQTEPEVGSPACPTVGSKGHFDGTCKPCAFLYTKGCGNGASCAFCHLCDAGEKKRRGQQKRAAKHTAKKEGVNILM